MGLSALRGGGGGGGGFVVFLRVLLFRPAGVRVAFLFFAWESEPNPPELRAAPRVEPARERARGYPEERPRGPDSKPAPSGFEPRGVTPWPPAIYHPPLANRLEVFLHRGATRGGDGEDGRGAAATRGRVRAAAFPVRPIGEQQRPPSRVLRRAARKGPGREARNARSPEPETPDALSPKPRPPPGALRRAAGASPSPFRRRRPVSAAALLRDRAQVLERAVLHPRRLVHDERGEERRGGGGGAAPRRLRAEAVSLRERRRRDGGPDAPTKRRGGEERKRNVAEYASKNPRARTRKTAEKGPPAFSAMALAAKTTASVACATHAMAAISTAAARRAGRHLLEAAKAGEGAGARSTRPREGAREEAPRARRRGRSARSRRSRGPRRDEAPRPRGGVVDLAGYDPSVAADAAPHAQCASRSASWRRASLAISRAVGRGICGGTHGVGAKFAGKRCGGAFAPAHLASLPGAAKTPHGSTPRSPATRGAPGEGRISAVVTATTGIWIAANASDRAQRDAHEAGERRRESVASGCATAEYACATAKATAKAQAHPPTRRHSCISATSRAYHAWSIAIEPGGDPRRAGAIAIARGDVRGRGAGGGGGETNDLKSRFKVRLGDDDGRRARDAARR